MFFKRKSVYIVTFLFIILSYFSYAQEPPCEISGQYSCQETSCAGGLCNQEGFEACNVATTPNAGDWVCGGVYITPEFGLVPRLVTFLSSLGIPYWLFRRRK